MSTGRVILEAVASDEYPEDVALEVAEWLEGDEAKGAVVVLWLLEVVESLRHRF